MVGIILTGHGDFPKGLYSALQLLAGKPELFKCVAYNQEDATDDYEYKLKDAIKDLEDCSGILIMTDVVGQTPFKIASELKMKYQTKLDIEIVTGTNLGMVNSINLARGYMTSLNDLADMAIEEGQKNIKKYVRSEYEDE